MPIKIFCGGLPAVAALLILLPGVASVQAADGATTLAPVTVVAAPVDEAQDLPLTGKSTLTAEQIKALPARNGSLNELLTVMPGVQAGEMSNTSLQGGEILPPNLSISGGRFYDNNFMIDGIGNNNLLDPAGNDPEAINDLPGHPQSLFLAPDLIHEITVYRSNIPVEFGGFTGGVVDADTRRPSTEFGGKIDLRTTRSSWTRFHLADEHESRYSSSVSRQPRFGKYDGGVSFDIPVTDNSGFLVAYRQIHSKIPLVHLGEEKDQKRELENIFLKYSNDVSSRTSLDLSFFQSPYSEQRFREASSGSEIKNSWHTLEKDNYRMTSSVSHEADFAVFEIKGGFQKIDEQRNAPTNYFNWRMPPKDVAWENQWSKNWGTKDSSKEGGPGDIRSSQEDTSLTFKAEVSPLETGPLEHNIIFGYGFERQVASFEREEESSIFTVIYQDNGKIKTGIDSSIICSGDIACVDNEQFAETKVTREPDSVNETINMHYLFVQDEIIYKRLSIRPGLRYSNNNYMQINDIDKRLAASVDVFGNGNTVLIGGVNRYYGKHLLAYKLSEAKKPLKTYKRNKDKITNEPTGWVFVPQVQSIKKHSDLETPYSDEITVGLNQSILGGKLNLSFVDRNSEKEFSSEYYQIKEDNSNLKNTVTIPNNNGSTRHKEYVLEYDNSFKNHEFSVNYTNQKTFTTNNDYYGRRYGDLPDTVELCVDEDQRLINCDDIPRQDYNRKDTINFIYKVNFPYGFTFTNHTKYRSGYVEQERRILTSDEKIEAGIPNENRVYLFEEDKQPESWIFNWKLDWRRNLYRSQGIRLSLEVNNVFNQKVPAGAAEEIQTYELGRQFWAGMEYYF